jgi:hypothetical protein
VTGAGAAAKRRRRTEFRRLRTSELLLLAIPVAIAIALPVLFSVRPQLAVPAIVAGLLAGLGTAFLPGTSRLVVTWVAGLGAALAWGMVAPALALSWLLLFPAALAVGSHLRALRAGNRRPDPEAG